LPTTAQGTPGNGLLLRSDLHKLFDRGYVTVSPDLRFVVSRRIREEFENGRDYYARNGSGLALRELGGGLETLAAWEPATGGGCVATDPTLRSSSHLRSEPRSGGGVA